MGTIAVRAATIDGRWTAATDTPNPIVLELQSDGAKLTGWFTQRTGKLEIAKGSIQGDRLSFEVSREFNGTTYSLTVSGELAGDELRLTLQLPGIPQTFTLRRLAPDAKIDLFADAPAPPEVAPWVKANAIRLSSLDSTDFSDLAPLAPRLRDARIVAVGEATHATREFQQLKIRLFRFLVEQLGFTVFAIESNWPESLAVNEYILGGNADPVQGLGFDWWRTPDMLSMLHWMREYNQDPAHTRKLKFYGVDMQAPGLAASRVLDYLRRVDPDAVAGASRTFAFLGDWAENPEYEHAPADVKHATADSLATLLRRFDDRKQAYIARSSEAQWTVVRQHMVIVKQAEVKLANQGSGTVFRDRAMAENAQWVLNQEAPGTKMMLWAHNAHIAGIPPDEAPNVPMGGHLRQMFGEAAVLCGFSFEEGSFRAYDMKANVIRDYTVGTTPAGSLDATLGGLGMPLFALDLRHLPAGPVANWFAAPHVSHQIGGGYSEETPGVWLKRVRASRAFDLLLFVQKTTPSKPLY